MTTPRAAPGRYEGKPAYRANALAADAVRRWARTKPGFVDLWIDREHAGWINVLFTRDARARQAQLERRFPGVRAVVVRVENSRRTLRRLARRVGAFVQERGLQAAWGWSSQDNTVRLDLNVVDDELARALEVAFAGEPLCVDGADPDQLVAPGPQPMAGDGWTMLAWEQGHGPAHAVGLASDEGAYQALWRRTRLEGTPPAVDFSGEIVVWFAIGHGSSCPNLRLDEIVVDHGRSQVYPLIVDADNPIACTDDLVGAYQFVVALDRSALPAGPFDVGLPAGDGTLWRSLSVSADLSQPGAVVGADVTPEPPG